MSKRDRRLLVYGAPQEALPDNRIMELKTQQQSGLRMYFN
ncbi:hypothetical protein PROVRETT_07014 [Providencia rettgeri DSM 1131]|nr:hypothetical protein PROVRETT_07014 [Providencia rettgeri DSM 1131]